MEEHELYTNGAFQKSELAYRTMAGQVVLTKQQAFSKDFAEKPSPSCTLSRI